MEPLFDQEEKKELVKISKFFFLPFLGLAITGFLYHKLGVESKPLLKLVFPLIVVIGVASIIRFFYTEFKKIGRVASEGELDRAAIKITVRAYRNPLILKYKIIVPLVAILGLAYIGFFRFVPLKTVYEAACMLVLLTIFLLYSTPITVTTYFGGGDARMLTKGILWKSTVLLRWEKIIPYFKRAEYKEGCKSVVVYTSRPDSYQEDKFSPIRFFFFPPYGNFFVPVNNASEANQVMRFLENRRKSWPKGEA